MGIGHGDMVMLILKRRIEFWFSIIALHKIGAVCHSCHAPADKERYRLPLTRQRRIKMIVCAGEEVITTHVKDSLAESPSVEKIVVSVGPFIPEGFLDFQKGIAAAKPFVRPAACQQQRRYLADVFH
jgi:acetyl-CoA synthetase